MASMRNNNKIINITVAELRIHPVAQRRIVPSMLKKIMSQLDLDAIGTIHVVYYPIDGVLAYWVIDGQHRVEALKQMGFTDWKVKAEIHVDIEDTPAACRRFLQLNNRAVVAAHDMYMNDLTSGDEAAVGVNDVCTALGLSIHRAGGDGHVTCVKTLIDLWRVDHGETLHETLRILVAAGGRTAPAVDGGLVSGLGLFLGRYNGQVDRASLTKRLATYPGGVSGLLGNAKGLKMIRRSSLSSCVVELVVQTYNSGRRVYRLDD